MTKIQRDQNKSFKPKRQDYELIERRLLSLGVFINTLLYLLELTRIISPAQKTDIQLAYRLYTKSLVTSVRYEGKKGAIILFKALYNISCRIAINTTFEPLEFRKSKDGIPNLLMPLVPLLRSDVLVLKKIGLTIARLYLIIRLEARLDTSAITKPQTECLKDSKDSFTSFVLRYLGNIGYPEPKISFTFGQRAGPNGPAVITAHYDAWALKDNETLYKAWCRAAEKTRSPLRSSFSHILEYPLKTQKVEELLLGKLSFLPENGGKTRIIAIVDFWTQQLLKPIHNQIMAVLNKIPMDGTKDQAGAFKRVLSCSKGKNTYSFDLSSATDRFPLYLQVPVLQALYDKEFSELWKTLLTERDFYTNKEKKGRKIRWAVGQPLGCYSSWVVFTLAHHLVVQYAAYCAYPHKAFRLWDFQDYQILGDDIVIWDELVASFYKRFMDDHGVDINLQKSFTSNNNTSFGEFCKRIFREGVDLSPLSPVQLESAKKCIYYIPALLRDLVDKWQVPTILVELYASKLFASNKKGQKLIEILMGFTSLMKGEITHPFCCLGLSLTDLIKELKAFTLAQYVKLILGKRGRKKISLSYSTLSGSLNLGNVLLPYFKDWGIEVSTSLLLVPRNFDSEDPHPIVLAYVASRDAGIEQHQTEVHNDDMWLESDSIETQEPPKDEFKTSIDLIKSTKSSFEIDLASYFTDAKDRQTNKKQLSAFAITYYNILLGKTKSPTQGGTTVTNQVGKP